MSLRRFVRKFSLSIDETAMFLSSHFSKEFLQRNQKDDGGRRNVILVLTPRVVAQSLNFGTHSILSSLFFSKHFVSRKQSRSQIVSRITFGSFELPDEWVGVTKFEWKEPGECQFGELGKQSTYVSYCVDENGDRSHHGYAFILYECMVSIHSLIELQCSTKKCKAKIFLFSNSKRLHCVTTALHQCVFIFCASEFYLYSYECVS